MAIRVECDSCHQVIQAKDGFAGRKIRCPGCQAVMRLPELGTESDDFEPELPLPPPKRSKPAARKRGRSSAGAPWYRGHWHWLVVLAVLVLAPIPKVGFALAGFVALAGAGMALIGGVFPFLKIILSDPGTVLSMLVSRNARFDMMRQPDSHPYKVLVRNAFNPTRGLFWRGVLLVVVFIPAAFISSFSGDLFKGLGADDPQPPPVMPAGPALMQPGRPADAVGAAPIEQVPPMQGFGPRPFGPPRRPGSDQLHDAEINYNNFTGQGTPTEAVQRVLGNYGGIVPGTLQVDEGLKSIRFQHRGPINPRVFIPLLGRQGFGSLRMSSQSAGPG